jgi:HEPN domain-containing protein
MSDKIIKNWLALADYDYVTAKAMFQSGRYIYVAFTCQQAVEKMFKAIYVKEYQKTPPYIHSLTKLANSMPFFPEFSETQLYDLEKLNAYYLQSRYSDQIQEMMAQFTHDQAAEFLQITEALMQWLRYKL